MYSQEAHVSLVKGVRCEEHSLAFWASNPSLCKIKTAFLGCFGGSGGIRLIVGWRMYLQEAHVSPVKGVRCEEHSLAFWASNPSLCKIKTAFSGCFGGSGGIRTPVGLHPNGFQDRLVVTASIHFHTGAANQT